MHAKQITAGTVGAARLGSGVADATKFLRGDQTWQAPTAAAENTGIAILDFGSAPQTDATVAVTGQAGILATSKVQVWIQGDTTAENTEADHLLAGQILGVAAGIPVAGTGFTIDASATRFLVAGAIKARWAWQ